MSIDDDHFSRVKILSKIIEAPIHQSSDSINQGGKKIENVGIGNYPTQGPVNMDTDDFIGPIVILKISFNSLTSQPRIS